MARSLWLTLVLPPLVLVTGCLAPPPPPVPVPAPNSATPATPVVVPPTSLPPPTTTPAASPTTPKAPPPPPPNPAVTTTNEPGVISGVVRWDGDVPEGGIDTSGLTVSVDGRQVPVKLSPRLQVHPQSKGVAGTVVWLVNPPAEPLRSLPEPPVLKMREGDFRPHLLLAPKGTRLELASADDQALFQARGAADFSETVSRGSPVPAMLNRPGLVTLGSSLTPWSSAYVWVFDHNYYAQTNEEGRFRLPAVPPGSYQVRLWHEGWRTTDKAHFTVAPPVEKEVKVELGQGQGSAIQWTLSSP
jgi:Carboxypeptidase regulatory-like domain